MRASFICSFLLFLIISPSLCQPRLPGEKSRDYPLIAPKIDLNQATEEEFLRLPLLKREIIAEIIKWRKEHPFRRVEDILFIRGVGEYTYLHLRKHLFVSSSSPISSSSGGSDSALPLPHRDERPW